MFIKKVEIRGFGKMWGTCDFAEKKCNVICQENEYGKSTLADSILYGFYGIPNTGFKKTELKPREKYRPWVERPGQFEVQIDLTDQNGRNLKLRTSFGKQQPFDLRDADTMQPVPLEGLSFGERYFKMGVNSFAECFFLRQDEHDNGGRAELVKLVEAAATSSRRDEAASVSVALEKLSQSRIHLPEFSSGAITVENLLRKIEDKLAGVQTSLLQVEQERTQRAEEIANAESMDSDIKRLEEKRQQLEFLVLLAETDELDQQIQRYESMIKARDERAAQVESLREYAGIDPDMQSRIQSLYVDWSSAQRQLSEAKEKAAEADSKLQELNQEVVPFGEAFHSVSRDSLDRLRSQTAARASLLKTASDAHDKVRRLRDELEAEGIIPETYSRILDKMSTLSAADKAILLNPHLEQVDERAVTEARNTLENARIAAAQAKGARNRAHTMTGVSATVAVVSIAFAVVMFLTKMPVIGAILILLAIGWAIAAAMHYRSAERIRKNELDPAVAQEVSLTGEFKRLNEHAEKAQTELAEVLTRNNLSADDHELMRTSSEWFQALNPYDAAVKCAANIDDSLYALEDEIDLILAPLGMAMGEEITTEAELEEAVNKVRAWVELLDRKNRLESDLQECEQEIAEAAEDVQKTAQVLEEVLEAAQLAGSPETLGERIQKFLDGCRKAIELRTVNASHGGLKEIDPAELHSLRTRVDETTRKLNVMLAARPDLANLQLSGVARSTVQAELESLNQEREELRIRRINAFNECDRAVQRWRQEGPQLVEERDRLIELRRSVLAFKQSVTIATDELSRIAEIVFTQWASALSKRLNEVLAEIKSPYHDASFDEQLELSLYSDEAGRRLDAREVQHLSKGARDQVLIAVRVAISEYLSAHVGALPIVLDEPFAHWDDRRFVDGMKFLSRLATRHQVIVLSCHRLRYTYLERNHPELVENLNFCSVENLAFH